MTKQTFRDIIVLCDWLKRHVICLLQTSELRLNSQLHQCGVALIGSGKLEQHHQTSALKVIRSPFDWEFPSTRLILIKIM
jgi:hypothetical protein